MPSTYDPITTTTLSSSQTSFTISSIPSGYSDLKVIITSKSANTGNYITYQYNGDTATNYSNIQLYGTGAAANGVLGASNSFHRALYQSWQDTGSIAYCSIDIFGYTGSSYKSSLAVASNDKNGSGTVERNQGTWLSTAAITSITFGTDGGGSFGAGTVVSIYGIKEA